MHFYFGSGIWSNHRGRRWTSQSSKWSGWIGWGTNIGVGFSRFSQKDLKHFVLRIDNCKQLSVQKQSWRWVAMWRGGLEHSRFTRCAVAFCTLRIQWDSAAGFAVMCHWCEDEKDNNPSTDDGRKLFAYNDYDDEEDLLAQYCAGQNFSSVLVKQSTQV